MPSAAEFFNVSFNMYFAKTSIKFQILTFEEFERLLTSLKEIDTYIYIWHIQTHDRQVNMLKKKLTVMVRNNIREEFVIFISDKMDHKILLDSFFICHCMWICNSFHKISCVKLIVSYTEMSVWLTSFFCEMSHRIFICSWIFKIFNLPLKKSTIYI